MIEPVLAGASSRRNALQIKPLDVPVTSVSILAFQNDKSSIYERISDAIPIFFTAIKGKPEFIYWRLFHFLADHWTRV